MFQLCRAPERKRINVPCACDDVLDCLGLIAGENDRIASIRTVLPRMPVTARLLFLRPVPHIPSVRGNPSR